MTTSYTRLTHGRRDGNPSCAHCGQVPRQHHSNQRCYTPTELAARRRFAVIEGRWPEPEEGCGDTRARAAWRRLRAGLVYALCCLAVGVVYGVVLWWVMGRTPN